MEFNKSVYLGHLEGLNLLPTAVSSIVIEFSNSKHYKSIFEKVNL